MIEEITLNYGDKTVEELTAKVEALKAEHAECTRAVERGVAAGKRLRELNRGWHSNGEIRSAELEDRDAYFPILERCDYGNYRIVAVSDKWVSVREDGRDDITDYSTSTGFKKHSKSEHSAIDSDKAMAIWKAHIARKP